jgi:hypothetical protein
LLIILRRGSAALRSQGNNALAVGRSSSKIEACWLAATPRRYIEVSWTAEVLARTIRPRGEEPRLFKFWVDPSFARESARLVADSVVSTNTVTPGSTHGGMAAFAIQDYVAQRAKQILRKQVAQQSRLEFLYVLLWLHYKA